MLNILIIAFALSMDAFAVSTIVGLNCSTKRRSYEAFRVAAHFGFFQFIMPLIGYFAGKNFLMVIKNYDHWVAFGLLTFIGVHMIFESRESEEIKIPNEWKLLFLSLATSIDAFAAGLGFAVLRISIFLPCVIIGITTFTLSFVGVGFGYYIGRKVSSYAEIFGGLTLIGIGLKILIEHIFF
ncbi:MAG: manganese efflux pump family protein [Thermotogaceae bacterium]|nr:manganese efflux pump family protein [Thermotogaceae bacterium]